MKKKPAKETSAKATQVIDEMKKKGIKVLSFYWTLGRYDTRSSAFLAGLFPVSGGFSLGLPLGSKS